MSTGRVDKNPQAVGEQIKYYLGNTKLPKAGQKYKYTPHMLKEVKKCASNIVHFATNYFYIVSLDKGRIKIPLYTCQKEMLKMIKDNRFSVIMASRQSGKSTIITIFTLWTVCFNQDQRVLIVANKEDTAKKIFARVKVAYEMLPNWMKVGVEEWAKTSMKLENGSSISISTTSSDAGRGDSCNLLLLDELAFIPDNMMNDFWSSVYPIISSSKKSKIVAVSTPYGTDNLFYRLYSGAEKRENGWEHMVIPWHMIPGRDEEWKKQTIANIGSEEIFEREFNCNFDTGGDNLLDLVLYNKLKAGCEDAKYTFDDGNYKIWKDPNPDSIYVAGVDIAEGVGEDNSCIQIFDISDLRNIEQVACYANNRISPINFATKVNDILYHWGTPPAMIERNTYGTTVVDMLVDAFRYPYVVSYSAKIGKLEFKKPGIYAHTNTKMQGSTNMRYWLNQLQVIKIKDKELISELQTFVRYSNGLWSAKVGEKDDRVMSMMWALLILKREIYPRFFTAVEYDDNMQPLKLELNDHLTQHFNSVINGVNIDYDALWESPEVIISDGNNSNYTLNEIEQLEKQGWRTLHSNTIPQENEQYYPDTIIY